MKHALVKLTGLLVVLTLVLSGCNLIAVDPIKQLDEDFDALKKDYSAVVAEYDGGQVTKVEVLGPLQQQLYTRFCIRQETSHNGHFRFTIDFTLLSR